MIGIIGLGYVGLPLAIEFAKIFKTVGFEIDKVRVNNLKRFYDQTNEVLKNDLENLVVNDFKENNNGLMISCNPDELKTCDYIMGLKKLNE